VTLCRFPARSFEEILASASPDLLREMVRGFAQRMMDADVEVRCGAGYGQVSPDRVNSRNGYRQREWDTRAGTIELAIPKLRTGSYFPSFLEHRRRAERALASVVATSYLLGSRPGGWEKLAVSLGVTGLSKSQVSVMPGELDELVEGFRSRPLDAGPYTFVWIDALTQKVREGGRTINVHALIATGVNAGGHREILGIDVTSSEDGAGWLAFLRGLVARGLSGVQVVTSDDHAGLVNAIAAVLPGAAWQRCRTHYHRNLLTQVPKTAQPWVPTLVRTIFEQPDANSVHTQHAQVAGALQAKLPAAAAHLDEARSSCAIPISALVTSTMPNSASFHSPQTRITASRTPSSKLNLVKMLARRMSATERLVCSPAAFVSPRECRSARTGSQAPVPARPARCAWDCSRRRSCRRAPGAGTPAAPGRHCACSVRTGSRSSRRCTRRRAVPAPSARSMARPPTAEHRP
jgi:putative transposase